MYPKVGTINEGDSLMTHAWPVKFIIIIMVDVRELVRSAATRVNSCDFKERFKN